MNERRVPVRLGARSYAISIGSGIARDVGARLRSGGLVRPRRALVVSNTTVWPLHGQPVLDSLDRARFSTTIHLVRDGERYKNLAEVERATGAAISAGIERGDPVIAVGGGVVGDLAGLVAALYMRGTPVVHVPTTLLAQIDSSVGGKVAVNHPRGKNLIGAFHQPLAVFTDPATLATLPRRELASGMYEAIKYAVMADANLFRWIDSRLERLLELDPADVARLIERCCRIKARIVARDERESGVRRHLNLGHTAGHAIETVTRYRRLRHGEAVGYGLEVAAELSRRTGRLTAAEAIRIRRLVARVGRRPSIADLDPLTLLDAMRSDKKRAEGRIGFVLPDAVGSVVFDPKPRERDIVHSIQTVLDESVV